MAKDKGKNMSQLLEEVFENYYWTERFKEAKENSNQKQWGYDD